MATNRKFKLPPDTTEADLSSEPPGPPPKPGMVWFGSAVGWKRVVTDDPEDREPLPPPKGQSWSDKVSGRMDRRRGR